MHICTGRRRATGAMDGCGSGAWMLRWRSPSAACSAPQTPKLRALHRGKLHAHMHELWDVVGRPQSPTHRAGQHAWASASGKIFFQVSSRVPIDACARMLQRRCAAPYAPTPALRVEATLAHVNCASACSATTRLAPAGVCTATTAQQRAQRLPGRHPGSPGARHHAPWPAGRLCPAEPSASTRGAISHCMPRPRASCARGRAVTIACRDQQATHISGPPGGVCGCGDPPRPPGATP